MYSSELLSWLTRDAVFGMNLLTVAGFVLMALGLNLSRTRRIRPSAAFALMGAGTVLVFAGVYLLHVQAGGG